MMEGAISGMFRPKTGGNVTPATAMPSPEVNGSGFAKKVVSDLGVKGDDANAAAAIIDRVAQITPAQLEALDPATRAQILRVRRDLKLESPDSLPTAPPRGEYNRGSSSASGGSGDASPAASPPSPRHRTPSFSEKNGEEPTSEERLRDHYRPERVKKTWTKPVAAPAVAPAATMPAREGDSERLKARTRRRKSFLDLL